MTTASYFGSGVPSRLRRGYHFLLVSISPTDGRLANYIEVLMARPTDYTPELLEKAKYYLENFEELGDVVPTVAGMACEIGVHRDTLYAWGRDEDKPEFSDILITVMQWQERKLVNGGLAGGFNPAVTKMMLTKHGYSDKQEIDHRSGDGSMSPKGKTLDDFYTDDVPPKSEP